jgi:hypothetical protein
MNGEEDEKRGNNNGLLLLVVCLDTRLIISFRGKKLQLEHQLYFAYRHICSGFTPSSLFLSDEPLHLFCCCFVPFRNLLSLTLLPDHEYMFPDAVFFLLLLHN